MQTLQPRTLNHEEFISRCNSYLDTVGEMPRTYQNELLRRFTAEATFYEIRRRDPNQLDLFTDTK